ncbi:MAG: precorrin-8X methylmutase [Lachnospiraceae bacterium]|nr:precorrin-8X methylmutase [Lachnospiraceae bacterium]
MKMDIEFVRPEEIENRSFELIAQELGCGGMSINGGTVISDDAPEAAVIKRCIHTTADFDYAKSMYFSKGAMDEFAKLLKAGATIVTDTNMALAGINKAGLAKFGCIVRCFMADEDVAKEAKERGLTRAHVSMEHAMSLPGPVIFVIGNAPTALITLRDHYNKGLYEPAFIVGVPVGFVNVVAAKELIIRSDIAHIVNGGRKGGSNVAAAIVNAVVKVV